MLNRMSLLLAAAAGAALPAAAQERATQRIDTHASHSELSGDLGAWRETTATYSAEPARGSIVAIQLEAHSRFEIEEQFAELRLSQRLAAGTLQIAVGGAGNGVFKPRFSLRADLEAEIGPKNDGWQLIAGAVASWYEGNEALALQFGASKRLTDSGWSGSAQLITINARSGTAPTGYSLKVSGPVSDGVTLSIGYADVGEPQQLDVATAAGWTASLIFEVGDHWQWRLDGASEERGGYSRGELGVGIARRF